MKSSKNASSSLSGDDRELFGFDDPSGARWMQNLLRATQASEPGDIGPYELLEEVAHGGQGVVYRARQPGTGREIALKRLRAASFASKAARRRFEREVEAACRLRHPGLVTVFGVEEVDGLAVLAMEWVEGVPVTDWVAARERPLEDALRAFMQICAAVQHAHQNGIIHRDLKPSNILVTPEGTVRVLDFGLAKSIEPGDDGDVTRSEDFVGTPAYASPEQLDRGQQPVDARTDVFALGVLLYEMLAGRRPFETEGGLRAQVEAIEAGHFVPLSVLDPRIRRDLDAVVSKAVASPCGERYASAAGLQEDVRRYLANEPVLAHPPSTWYELRKLARRNRPVFALACALVVTLALALLVTVRQSRTIAAERDLESAARRTAERATARAQTIAQFLVNDMLDAVDPGRDGPVTVADLLDAAAERAEARFADEPETEATVRHHLGKAYGKLGDYTQAEEQLAAAVRASASATEPFTDEELADVELARGQALNALERYGEAIACYDRAGELLLHGPEPDVDGTLRVLRAKVGVLWGRGDIEAVVESLEEGLELLGAAPPIELHDHFIALRNQRAVIRAQQGELESSRVELEEVLALARAHHGGESTQVADILGVLGEVDWALGRRDEARQKSEEALELIRVQRGERHPHYAAALGDMADLLTEPEDWARAESMIREALEIICETRGADSASANVYRVRLGHLLSNQGKNEAALDLLAPAVESMVAAGSDSFVWVHKGRIYLAEALRAEGRTSEAVETWETLLRAQEEQGLPRTTVLRALEGLAGAYSELGRHAESYEHLDEFLSLLEGSAAVLPDEKRERIARWAAWCAEEAESGRPEALELARRWQLRLAALPAGD